MVMLEGVSIRVVGMGVVGSIDAGVVDTGVKFEDDELVEARRAGVGVVVGLGSVILSVNMSSAQEYIGGLVRECVVEDDSVVGTRVAEFKDTYIVEVVLVVRAGIGCPTGTGIVCTIQGVIIGCYIEGCDVKTDVVYGAGDGSSIDTGSIGIGVGTIVGG